MHHSTNLQALDYPSCLACPHWSVVPLCKTLSIKCGSILRQTSCFDITNWSSAWSDLFCSLEQIRIWIGTYRNQSINISCCRWTWNLAPHSYYLASQGYHQILSYMLAWNLSGTRWFSNSSTHVHKVLLMALYPGSRGLLSLVICIWLSWMVQFWQDGRIAYWSDTI